MTDKIINYVALGKRIQKRRLQLGLSQSAAAEQLDLSTSFFGRVERGEKVASLETIIRIANTFGFSLDYLLQDSINSAYSDKIKTELAQIFSAKTALQSERMIDWLRVLSENIDRLS